MIFTPNQDEQEVINKLLSLQNNEYVVIRMTATMIKKNNLDCNYLFRDMLFNLELVDYEIMDNGSQNGSSYTALFIKPDKIDNVKLNFYRVNNNRGDRRFSIETLKRKCADNDIIEGDLLFFSSMKDDKGTTQLYFVNLTRNTPSYNELINIIGLDHTTKIFNELKPKLTEIINGGFYNNSKGKGKKAPKDVGDTLEYLLEIKTNNRTDADYKGLIEIKSKGEDKTRDTLFTLRPRFDNTLVAEIEPSDRNRVSAYTRLYGYESDKHPGYNSLYITIGSEDAPQNGHGFYLEVDETAQTVNIMRLDSKTGKKEKTAFWNFDDLKGELFSKHPATIWVKAESKEVDDMVQFNYHEVEFSRAPQFTTFITLIKTGQISYDWRGYTTKEGKYSGKNHGNAWRIKPSEREKLFGSLEKIDLTIKK